MRARRLLGLLGAALLLLGGLRLCEAIISGGSWTVPFTGFRASGGENKLSGADGVAARELVSSMGGEGAVRMEGGEFSIGNGIIGGFAAPQADLSAAHAFPVPFIPSQGHETITFTLLPAEVTIEVFTLSGELVKTISKADGNTDKAVWLPVHNERGQSIASGVYFYAITTPDGRKKVGKLMVIK